MRHSSARNVVERLFGIFKRRFKVLNCAPEYSTQTQAMLVSGLAALHNFIQLRDPSDTRTGSYTDDQSTNQEQRSGGTDEGGSLAHHISTRERDQATIQRDRIALDMWSDYLNENQSHSQRN